MSNSEEQEELQIGRRLTDDIIDENTTEKLKKNGMIIGLFVIIVLVAVGYYYYSDIQTKEFSQEAAMAMSKVMPEYEAGNYSIALDGGTSSTSGTDVTGLTTIVTKYGNTNEGKLAALYAGNAYVNSGQYAEAKTYFEKATDSDANIVQSGAYAGLALCEEEEGNYEQAAEKYKMAAEKLKEDTMKSKYLYYAALNYEQANKKENAKNIYNSIIELAGNSEFANKSKAKLSMLGTKID